MLKKCAVLAGIAASLGCLIIAILVYPGGSIADGNTVGFDWTNNFISNLFGAEAVNGMDNPARIWGDASLIILAVSFALFFIHFSRKLPAKGAAKVLRYLGTGNVLFISLIITPLHDLMVPIASTVFLVCLFYITVFILKSRLVLFKFSCVSCLLIFYYTFYLYGSGNWVWLAIMQKVAYISALILVLGLEYFTKKEDFASGSPVELQP